MKTFFIFCLSFVFNTISCKDDNSTAEHTPLDTDVSAEIVSVTTTGEENNYSFSIGIKSPDTGCNQYANWWEIISEEGNLIYRRILAHSHINEQPFVRSGGPVAIKKDQIVYVRAHMNTNGYGEKVFKGNVAEGFRESTLDKTFAMQLETTPPLPSGCAF